MEIRTTQTTLYSNSFSNPNKKVYGTTFSPGVGVVYDVTAPVTLGDVFLEKGQRVKLVTKNKRCHIYKVLE